MITLADGIGLLIGLVVVATVADRVRLPYPILLVVAGIIVAVLPIHHRVELEPDLFLLVFLPPLVYDASLDTSASELRTHLRPILLLAVGLVLATMTVVAVALHELVGGVGWGVAFALGAIVSPPDSVAATQIAGTSSARERSPSRAPSGCASPRPSGAPPADGRLGPPCPRRGPARTRTHK